jgi:hypothetical protein
MNLVDFGFQHSNLFRHMPRFDEISYLGNKEEKVRHYRAVREGQSCTLLALNFIRKDEKILWEAAEDFVKRSIADAIPKVHGVHVFDLLTVDIHKEINTFKHSELSEVIVNVASTLRPGGTSMVRYSSVFALVQKTVEAEWGKIAFKTAVDVFKDKPDYIDLLIKQILRDYMFPRDPVILLLNDLSQNPVFDAKNTMQQARIREVIANLIPNSMEFIPEVYIQDKHGARELLSGSTL